MGGSRWIPALQLLTQRANLSTETARCVVSALEKVQLKERKAQLTFPSFRELGLPSLSWRVLQVISWLFVVAGGRCDVCPSCRLESCLMEAESEQVG